MHKKRYPELDALRGVAAVFVMLFHYTLIQNSYWFFSLGVTGVDLFFLISGFVIFMSINSVATGTDFVINRVSRLYPTYWASATFLFMVVWALKLSNIHLNHAKEISITDYLANMTMFQYYLNKPDLDAPYWTMIIEMLFYLFILLLFELKLLKYITAIGCIINGIIILNFFLVMGKYIPNYTACVPLVNHFALFFAGITFYKLIHNLQHRLSGYLTIVFCLFTQTLLFKFAGSDPDHITYFQYIIMLLVYFAIFTLFINQKLKFIAIKPLLFLGRISFALYLIHSYIFRGLIGYLQLHFRVNFWLATLGVAVPGAILLATLITVYIEKPSGKKLKHLLQMIFDKQKPGLQNG